MRASFVSRARSFINSSRASALARSTSGFPSLCALSATASAASPLWPPPPLPRAPAEPRLLSSILQSLLSESLLAERVLRPLLRRLRERERLLLRLLLALAFELLLEELLLRERLRFLFRFLLRPRPREVLLPLPAAAYTSRHAREPACGETARRGSVPPSPPGASVKPALRVDWPVAIVRSRLALHLKHSKRFTKFRSPQAAQIQSRLLSSSSRLPRAAMLEPLPTALGFPTPLPQAAPSGASPMGRMLRAESLPSGVRPSSKVTCWPGMSRV
mmetsp:Transcript_103663/g.323119  ORF Transcript_103663/g.323119 Transcript_103663/m.323119 type:complete len:274 (+) Transcript_103663:267-1088(+)